MLANASEWRCGNHQPPFLPSCPHCGKKPNKRRYIYILYISRKAYTHTSMFKEEEGFSLVPPGQVLSTQRMSVRDIICSKRMIWRELTADDNLGASCLIKWRDSMHDLVEVLLQALWSRRQHSLADRATNARLNLGQSLERVEKLLSTQSMHLAMWARKEIRCKDHEWGKQQKAPLRTNAVQEIAVKQLQKFQRKQESQALSCHVREIRMKTQVNEKHWRDHDANMAMARRRLVVGCSRGNAWEKSACEILASGQCLRSLCKHA